MATGVRVAITLACTDCKRRNYQSQKSKRNTPDRVELRKYCRWCGSHTLAPRDALGSRRRPRWQERRDGQRRRRAARCGPASLRAQAGPAPVPAGPAPAAAVEHRARRGGFIRESVAELKKVEWPTRAQVIQGTIVVHHRLHHRRRVPLGRRPDLQAVRPRRAPRTVGRDEQMFHWYVINTYSGHENKVKANLEHRIVSMNQQRALPPRRRPDRAGDRDEGRAEGADREARPPRLRPRQHGPERRRLDGRQGHARRDRLRRRRREAVAALARQRSTGSSTRAASPARRRRGRRSSSRSASRSR